MEIEIFFVIKKWKKKCIFKVIYKFWKNNIGLIIVEFKKKDGIYCKFLYMVLLFYFNIIRLFIFCII